MILHVDGARFANAVVSAGKSAAELTWKAGVDALSFGATKNGCLAAEAVVLFSRAPAERPAELALRRKRGGHLISKSRFLAAQLEAYLTDDLWLRNARHANAAAQRLAAGLERVLGVAPAEPVEANEIFIALGAPLAKALRAAGFLFHDWPGIGEGGARLVRRASTTERRAVDAFVAAGG